MTRILCRPVHPLDRPQAFSCFKVYSINLLIKAQQPVVQFNILKAIGINRFGYHHNFDGVLQPLGTIIGSPGKRYHTAVFNRSKFLQILLVGSLGKLLNGMVAPVGWQHNQIRVYGQDLLDIDLMPVSRFLSKGILCMY